METIDLTNASPEQFRKEMEKMIQTCLRCGHKWIPRGRNIPTVCPECKSPYWNKPRTEGGLKC